MKRIPSQLPNNGRQVMAHSKGRQLAYRAFFRLAKLFGIWRYPAELDPDDWQRVWNDMYWLYKSGNPIIRAEKGSGLESHFARERLREWSVPPEFKPERTLTISAVGDLMNTKGIENSGDRFYERIAGLVFDADLSIANLESSLTSSPIVPFSLSMTDLPKINATEAQYNVIKGHKGSNFTVFCTANNHILDCGYEGFETTHDRLNAENFAYVGTNLSPESAGKGMILTLNGIKIGFVAATYSLNTNPFPDGRDYLVNVIPFHQFRGKVDLSLLQKQLAWCRSEKCDFIILSLHWGLEFEFYPRLDQIEIAHSLAESGADLILSHHAHNIQPYEFYQTRRDPDRQVPILYGLGNLSSIFSAPYAVLSLIANLTIAQGCIGSATKTLVFNFGITPVIQMEHDLDSNPWVRIEKLADLSAGTNSNREDISEISMYADMILGHKWRH